MRYPIANAFGADLQVHGLPIYPMHPYLAVRCCRQAGPRVWVLDHLPTRSQIGRFTQATTAWEVGRTIQRSVAIRDLASPDTRRVTRAIVASSAWLLLFARRRELTIAAAQEHPEYLAAIEAVAS